MSWSKLDDGIIDHPKFVGLSDAGWSLWTRALVWSNKHKTFGRLERTVAARLGARATIRELVTRRIWDARADGEYYIHDFHDYNFAADGTKPPPSPQLRAVRAAAGRRGAQSRWHGKADSKPDSKLASAPLTNKPAAPASFAAPDLPISRSPEQIPPRRGAASSWTDTAELARSVRERLPLAPEESE